MKPRRHELLIRGEGATGRVFSGEREVLPKDSLRIRNHSPTGFAWGYAGSGPTQLSLALLLDAGLPPEQATECHQAFKEKVVSRILSGKNFAFPRAWLVEWAESAQNHLLAGKKVIQAGVNMDMEPSS